MGAKFLCCLPLRLGVFVITFFQFIICGGFAGLLWWALWNINAKNSDIAVITQQMKTIIIVVASVYTAAALIGLLGFLGAIFKKNGFVKTFYILLCTVFALQVGSNIWFLVTFYRARGQSVEGCIDGSTNKEKIALCQAMDAYKQIPQGWAIASSIVPIVFTAYACYIVYQYTKRLAKQKLEKDRSHAFHKSMPSYAPVQRGEETYPLTQPTTTYPYTDTPNAFGPKPVPTHTAYAPVVHHNATGKV